MWAAAVEPPATELATEGIPTRRVACGEDVLHARAVRRIDLDRVRDHRMVLGRPDAQVPVRAASAATERWRDQKALTGLL